MLFIKITHVHLFEFWRFVIGGLLARLEFWTHLHAKNCNFNLMGWISGGQVLGHKEERISSVFLHLWWWAAISFGDIRPNIDTRTYAEAFWQLCCTEVWGQEQDRGGDEIIRGWDVWIPPQSFHRVACGSVDEISGRRDASFSLWDYEGGSVLLCKINSYWMDYRKPRHGHLGKLSQLSFGEQWRCLGKGLGSPWMILYGQYIHEFGWSKLKFTVFLEWVSLDFSDLDCKIWPL